MPLRKPAILGGDPECKRRIPFAKPLIGQEEIEAVREALEAGALASGEFVEKFEKEFARYVGVKHCIAVSNGTDALFISYLALDLTFGCRVLTTPLTFVATASAVIHAGAVPLFADVDEDSNLSPESVADVISREKVDGICVVHMYGRPCRMDEIISIARECGAFVIEDAAHAHGAVYKGRKVGSLGDIAAWSWYPAKIVAAGGWGGAITTNSDELAEKIRLLIGHGELKQLIGQRGAYEWIRLGYNMRMSNIEAAVAYCQLKKLEQFVEKRRKNAKLLTELLSDVPGLRLPGDPPYGKHVYYIYAIQLDEEKIGWSRDEFVRALQAEGIDARRGYHKPLHRQELFLKINDPSVNHFARVNRYPDYGKMSFPRAEELARTTVWLPIHPALTEEDIEAMARAIVKLVEWGRHKRL